jgi:PKD repeat protein
MTSISWRRAVRPPSTPRTSGRRASRSQGQAIVELALILPIFLILVASALDLGRLFYSQISVNDAAREAALEASQNPTSFIADTACTSANKEQNRVMCRATNESRGSFVTIAPADVAMECSTNPSPCPTTPALGQTVSVTVTGHFRLITPLLAVFFGGQDTTFSSTASAQLLSTPTAVTIPGPVASFTLTPDNGLTPLAVSFTDTSTGTGLSWGWAFGDGTTYAGQNPPAHTYAASGIFTVTLTVSNLGGTSVATHTVTVSDPAPAPPVASFNYNPSSGPAPLAVTFVDTSTGTPVSWAWDFGDGTVSTVKNPPVHTYALFGTYTVTLVVANGGGTDTVTHVVQANVVCPAPVSIFTVSPTSGRRNITRFDTTNSSTNMSTAGCNNIWSWNFGDGTGISSSQSPADHIYKKKGSYTIELTASNLGGTSTSSRTVTVTN